MRQSKSIIEQTNFTTPVVDSKSVVYGLRSTDTHGVVGWFLDDKLKVATYSTQKKAQKALLDRLKDMNYTWECTVEVAPFVGFEKNE